MKLARKIGLYEQTPLGYVPAWHDWTTHRDVCYPFGLHWVARLARGFWLWAMKPSRRQRYERAIYRRGWEAGRMSGIKEGKDQAIEVAKDLIRR